MIPSSVVALDIPLNDSLRNLLTCFSIPNIPSDSLPLRLLSSTPRGDCRLSRALRFNLSNCSLRLTVLHLLELQQIDRAEQKQQLEA